LEADWKEVDTLYINILKEIPPLTVGMTAVIQNMPIRGQSNIGLNPRNPAAELYALEMLEGLVAVVTVILRLAGGGTELTLQLGIQGVAIGAGDNLGTFQALQEIIFIVG